MTVSQIEKHRNVMFVTFLCFYVGEIKYFLWWNILYAALNCERDNFTKTCMLYMKQYKEKKVRVYEYLQSFNLEDKKNGLKPEKAPV